MQLCDGDMVPIALAIPVLGCVVALVLHTGIAFVWEASALLLDLHIARVLYYLLGLFMPKYYSCKSKHCKEKLSCELHRLNASNL